MPDNKPLSLIDMQQQLMDIQSKLSELTSQQDVFQKNITASLTNKLKNFGQSLSGLQEIIKAISERVFGENKDQGKLPDNIEQKIDHLEQQLETFNKGILTNTGLSAPWVLIAQFVLKLEILAEGSLPHSIDTIAKTLLQDYGEIGTRGLLLHTEKAVKTMNKPFLRDIVTQLVRYFKTGNKSADIDEEQDEESDQSSIPPEINEIMGMPTEDEPIDNSDSETADTNDGDDMEEMDSENIPETTDVNPVVPEQPIDNSLNNVTPPAITPSLANYQPSSILAPIGFPKFCDDCGEKLEQGKDHHCILKKDQTTPSPIIKPNEEKKKRKTKDKQADEKQPEDKPQPALNPSMLSNIHKIITDQKESKPSPPSENVTK